MKKITAIIMALTLCLSLCSCGNNQADPADPAASPGASATEDAAKNSSAPKEEKVPQHLKSAKYVEIIKSGKFYMEARITGANGESEMKMAKDGNLMGMTATMPDGTKAGLISKDDKNYIIDHENQLVMITAAQVAASASNMPAETLDTEGLTYSESATGTFLGKSLPYDEYKSASGAVTRFYLDGSSLAGIEAVSGDKTDVYEVTTLSETVPSELFDIPEGYQQYDMASVGG